jgi:hypothetical protein
MSTWFSQNRSVFVMFWASGGQTTSVAGMTQFLSSMVEMAAPP